MTAEVRAPQPDWGRLQRALSVEAESGFNNLVGKQQVFNDFLHDSLSRPPAGLAAIDRDAWQALAKRFGGYSDLSFSQRQHLVAETRRFLHQSQRQLEQQKAQALKAKESNRVGISGTGGHSRGSSTRIPPQTTSVAAGDGQSTKLPDLDQPVTYLKGVGPKNSERLAKLGLFTVRDVLFYYPRDHVNYANQVKIRDLVPGDTVTIVGTVNRVNCFTSPRNKKLTIFELQIADGSGRLKLNRFYPGNRYSTMGWQQQQKRQYPKGAVVAASGLVKKGKYGITLDDPHLEVLDSLNDKIESLTIGRMVPVYPLTEGVPADLVRKVVVASLPALPELPDPLPADIRQRYDLIPAPQAIAQVHFPDDEEHLAQARRRLVFDEFFYLQLGLLRRRQEQQQQQTAVTLVASGELIDRFYEALPFKFTDAQQRVVNDILADLQRPIPMNRLVQGDVGSGKTVVAVVAILAAIQAGYQGALSPPQKFWQNSTTASWCHG